MDSAAHKMQYSAALSAAFRCAKAGMPVFPCQVGKKIPATGNGFKAATTDENQIREWFESGKANLAVATGAGLVVFDLDTKNGHDGIASFRQLQSRHDSLPDTLTAITPSGGQHRLYRYDKSVKIRSNAGKLGNGIDVRADGGYIVAPPSSLPNGNYRWANKLPIAELPPRWLKLLADSAHATKAAKQKHASRTTQPASKQQFADLEAALNYINAHPHDDWVRVGMALHDLGDIGYRLWVRWSQTADNFNQQECEKRWPTFQNTALAPATIFHMAQSAGWQNPAKDRGRDAGFPHVIQLPGANSKSAERPTGEDDLGEGVRPEPLPDDLPDVMEVNYQWLPPVIADFVRSTAERMNVPADYILVTVLAALATVIGRKVGIRPQKNTTWTEVCNLWAMIIGRPGMLKSPAMQEGMKPIKRLVAKSNRLHKEEMKQWEAESKLEKMRDEAHAKNIKRKLDKNPDAEIDPAELIQTELEAPQPRRYVTSDSTPEALIEILRHNPNGIMVERDELVGLIKGMEREDRAEQRAIFLSGWNGNESYTTDRIVRGFNQHVEAMCLSVLGSTQPGKIAKYVQQAVKGTDGDDGLLQRFGAVVWPDIAAYKEMDEPLDKDQHKEIHRLFAHLDELKPEDIEASQDTDSDGNPDGVPFLRFDESALAIFRGWREKIENRLRSDDLHPAMESHLAKYRKLVPALALLLHLSDRGSGSVSEVPLLQAISLAEYFESHANRLYASVSMPDVAGAKQIVRKLQRNEIAQPFTARDIYRKGWAGLDSETVKDAIELLLEYRWLFDYQEERAGNTTVRYRLNPAAEK